MGNFRGIALMVAGMAGFAVSDLLLKLATQYVSVAEIVFVQAVGGVAVFLPLALRSGRSLYTPALLSRPVLVRISSELIAVICITTGLSMTDLSSASALMQAQPMLVMIFAAMFLAERIGWRRWLSVAVGFFGVLVILRPAGGIEPGLAFIGLGVLAMSARDAATRAVDPSISSVLLSLYSFGAAVPMSALWLLASDTASWPGAGPAGLLVAMSLMISLAFFLVTSALRQGEVSAIVPFRYTRLLFALILSMAFLGERPDLFVLLGAALVIGSGLYALFRERAHERRRLAQVASR